MYNCDTCLEEFSSQKNYLAHLEQCDDFKPETTLNTNNRSASRSASRSVTRTPTGTGVGRISNGVISADTRATVETLSRERTRLKNDYKKIVSAMKEGELAHKEEMKNVQDYFQDQIITLTEERDELAERLDSMTSEMYSEKERVRSEFVKKFSTDKKRLEIRHSSQLSKLGSLIDKLQIEKEEIKELLENKNDELADELRATKSSIETERDEIRKMSAAFADGKDAYKRECAYEKEREIKQAVFALEQNRSALEKKILELERSSVDTSLSHQNEIQKLKDAFAKKIERDRVISECAIRDAKQLYETKKQECETEAHNRVKALELSQANSLHSVKADTARQIQEITHANELLKHKIKDLETTHEREFCKLREEYSATLLKKEKELMDIISTNKEEYAREMQVKNESYDDMQKTNHIYENQVNHYKSAMDSMKMDVDKLKAQFVANLNRQQNDMDTAIKERESIISSMRADIGSINDEYNEKLQKVKAVLELNIREQDSLQISLKHKQEELDSRMVELEKVEKQKVELERNYELKFENMRKEYIAKIRNQKEETEAEYRSKIEYMQSKVDAANEGLDRLKKDFMGKMNEQRTSITKNTDTIIETTRAKCDESIKEKERIIQSLKDELENYTVNMSQKYTSHFEKIDVLQKELDQAKLQLLNTTEEIQRLRAEQSEKILNEGVKEGKYEQNILTLENQLHSAQEEKEKLKSALHALNIKMEAQRESGERALSQLSDLIKTNLSKQ